MAKRFANSLSVLLNSLSLSPLSLWILPPSLTTAAAALFASMSVRGNEIPQRFQWPILAKMEEEREKLWTSFTAVLPCRLLGSKTLCALKPWTSQHIHTHTHKHTHTLSRFLTITTHSLSSGNHSTHTHIYIHVQLFLFSQNSTLSHTHYFSDVCVSLSFYSFGQFYLELVQRRRKWTGLFFERREKRQNNEKRKIDKKLNLLYYLTSGTNVPWTLMRKK